MSYVIDTKVSLRLGVAVFCLALVWTRLVNFVYANVGFVIVNQAFLAEDEDASWLKAVPWFEGSDLATVGRGLGFVLATLGQEEDALAAWKRGGEDAQDFLVRGINARMVGDLETAVTWLNRANATNPDLADGWYELGLTYEALGNPEKAIVAYEQGLAKTEFLQIGASDFYSQLGFVMMRLVEDGDLETAVNYYDQALRQDNFGNTQSKVRTHFLRGEALNQSQQFSEAIAEYEWVIAQQPTHYWAYVRLGFLTWHIQQDANEAEKLFLQALTLNDQWKIAYRGLGIVYQETGRNEEAIEMYRKIVILDSDDKDALAALAALKR